MLLLCRYGTLWKPPQAVQFLNIESSIRTILGWRNGWISRGKLLALPWRGCLFTQSSRSGPFIGHPVSPAGAESFGGGPSSYFSCLPKNCDRLGISSPLHGTDFACTYNKRDISRRARPCR